MRTPLTIFALGLGACLAMGLVMQHLLRVSQERNQLPILREVNRFYGSRFDGEAKLRFVREARGMVAEVTVSPLIPGTRRDLAREIGQFVWRGTHDRELAGVAVVCEDPLGADSERIVVDNPFAAGASAQGAGARRPPAGPPRLTSPSASPTSGSSGAGGAQPDKAVPESASAEARAGGSPPAPRK